MREDYRDELAALHARVTQLEHDLTEKDGRIARLQFEADRTRRGASKAPTGSRATFVVVGVVAMAMFVVPTVVAIFFLRTRHAASAVIEATPSPAIDLVPSARTTVTLFPQTNVAPLITNVDDDADEDMISLFWDSHHEDSAIRVVALSGYSGAVLWSTAGYPSPWTSERTHLVLLEDFAVITDSKEGVHVLDPKTGVTHRSFTFPGGAFRACKAHAHADTLLLARPGEVELHPFDVVTGAEIHVTPKLVCENEAPACDENVEKNIPCEGFRPNVHPVSRHVTTRGTIEIQDRFIVKAQRENEDKTLRAEEFAIGGDRKSGLNSWERRVAADNDHEEFGEDSWAIARDGKSFFVAYPLREGPWKLVARASQDGSLRWQHALMGTNEGTRFQSLRVTENRVYAVTNQELHVYQALSGELLHEVSVVTIPLAANPRAPR